MFDLSLPELVVIALVALLVLGPRRLPQAARTAGALLRRAQRSWAGLRQEIERELAADELKRQLDATQQELAAQKRKLSRSLSPTALAEGGKAPTADDTLAKPPGPAPDATADRG